MGCDWLPTTQANFHLPAGPIWETVASQRKTKGHLSSASGHTEGQGLFGEGRGVSVFGISHAVGVNGEHGLGLREARRVVDLTDPGLTAALPQVQPGG